MSIFKASISFILICINTLLLEWNIDKLVNLLVLMWFFSVDHAILYVILQIIKSFGYNARRCGWRVHVTWQVNFIVISNSVVFFSQRCSISGPSISRVVKRIYGFYSHKWFLNKTFDLLIEKRKPQIRSIITGYTNEQSLMFKKLFVSRLRIDMLLTSWNRSLIFKKITIFQNKRLLVSAEKKPSNCFYHARKRVYDIAVL